MSHEIRTPMNGVVAMTSLLAETKLTGEQREYTRLVQRSSEAMLAIIDDILDFSRIESGKWVLEDEPYDLRVCVRDAVTLLAPRAAEKRLELAYFVDFQVPRIINGDADRVRQILINLISNAVKFTDDGGIFVHVFSEHQGHNRFTIQFEVHDTGIGIKPEDMDQLYQSFSQVDSSNTRRHGGTGLGLAISRGLARLMNGELWATSDIDNGSIFYLRLSATAVNENAGFRERWDITSLSNRKALLLSEYETNRKLLSEYIGHWGLDYLDTQPSSDALHQVLEKEVVDITIVDIEGDVNKAIKIVEDIRAIRPEQPIIFFISLVDKLLGERLREFDKLTTIHKPISPSGLLGALQEYLIPSEPLAEAFFHTTMAANRIESDTSVKILVAEDNLINQKVVIRLLTHLGLRADLAVNGVEAVKALSERPYDIVLMDVQMPEMDGIEATRYVRQDQAIDHQPHIIALTAAAMHEERELCMEAGMNDFLAKPIRLEDLSAALNRYLHSQR